MRHLRVLARSPPYKILSDPSASAGACTLLKAIAARSIPPRVRLPGIRFGQVIQCNPWALSHSSTMAASSTEYCASCLSWNSALPPTPTGGLLDKLTSDVVALQVQMQVLLILVERIGRQGCNLIHCDAVRWDELADWRLVDIVLDAVGCAACDAKDYSRSSCLRSAICLLSRSTTAFAVRQVTPASRAIRSICRP
jgi:hypothetical protein